MTFKTFIKEEYLTSVKGHKAPFWSGTDKPTAEIFKNPTSSEYREVLQLDPEVRGIITGNGDILIWSSKYAEHYDVYKELSYLKRQPNVAFYIFTDRKKVEISGFSMEGGNSTLSWEDEYPKIINIVKKNPHLKKLAGGYSYPS